MSSASYLSTHCILLPRTGEPATENSEHVYRKDNCVCSSGTHSVEMAFDAVHDSVTDVKTTVYDPVVSPLIRRTAEGDSTLCILGGDRDESYLTSLLQTSITELLQLSETNGIKHGVVKLVWFTVGADGFEHITDVLKMPQPAILPSGIVPKCVELVLRDLTSGRGMIVPGLFEVEICNDEDIQVVLEHVHSVSAALTNAAVHSVVQVTFTDLRKVDLRAKKKNFVALRALKDPAGLGRVTIVQLSTLRAEGPKLPLTPIKSSPSPQKNTRSTTNNPNSATKNRFSTILPTEPVVVEPVTESGNFYPWIEHTRQVVQWMEKKRASTPFHKSRLLLLLKDMLLRRQSAALLLILQPTAIQHSVNLDWLRVVWLLSRNYAPPPAALAPRGAVSSNRTNISNNSVNRPQMQPIDVSAGYIYNQSEYNINDYGFQTTAESAVDTVHSGTSGSSSHSQGGKTAYNSVYADQNGNKLYHTPSPRSASHERTLSRVNSMDNNSVRNITPRAHSSRAYTPRATSTTNNPTSPDTVIKDRDSALRRAVSSNAILGAHNSPKHAPMTTESAGMKKRFFRSTLERIEGEIFEGYKANSGIVGVSVVNEEIQTEDMVEEEEVKPYVPAVTPRRTKPATPKHKMKHLTAKEVSAAMRALSLRNKKAAQAAAVAKETMLEPPAEPEPDPVPVEAYNHNYDAGTGVTAEAEVEDLKTRLQEAQGRCTVLETEKGLPLSYPSEIDENLFYTKWGPIGKSKRRSSVQMFIQAHGAAVDGPGAGAGAGAGLPPPLTGSGSRSVDRFSVSGGESMDAQQGDARGVEVACGVSVSGSGGGSGGSGGGSGVSVGGSGSGGGSGGTEQEAGSVGGVDNVNRDMPTGPGKSMYEQLMEAITSLRALEAKYKDLDGKYNTLLAASQRPAVVVYAPAASSQSEAAAPAASVVKVQETVTVPVEAVLLGPASVSVNYAPLRAKENAGDVDNPPAVPAPAPVRPAPPLAPTTARPPSVTEEVVSGAAKAPTPVHRSSSLSRTASAPASSSGWNSSTRLRVAPVKRVSVNILYPVPTPAAPAPPPASTAPVVAASAMAAATRTAPAGSSAAVTPRKAAPPTPTMTRNRTSSHVMSPPLAASAVNYTPSSALTNALNTKQTTAPATAPSQAPIPNATMSLFAEVDADTADSSNRRRSISSDAPPRNSDENDADSSFESVENVDESITLAAYVSVSEPLLEHDSIYNNETDVVTYAGVNIMSHKDKDKDNASHVPFSPHDTPNSAQASFSVRPTPSPSQQGKFSLHNVRPDLLFKAGSRGSVRSAASLLSPARPGSFKSSPLTEKIGKGLFSTPVKSEGSAVEEPASHAKVAISLKAMTEVDSSSNASETTSHDTVLHLAAAESNTNSDLTAATEVQQTSHKPFVSSLDAPAPTLEPSGDITHTVQEPPEVVAVSATIIAPPLQASSPEETARTSPERVESSPPEPHSTSESNSSAVDDIPVKKPLAPQQFRLPPMVSRPALRSTGKATPQLTKENSSVGADESSEDPAVPLPPSPPVKSAPSPPSRRFSSILANRRRPSRVKPFTSAPSPPSSSSSSVGGVVGMSVPPVPLQTTEEEHADSLVASEVEEGVPVVDHRTTMLSVLPLPPPPASDTTQAPPASVQQTIAEGSDDEKADQDQDVEVKDEEPTEMEDSSLLAPLSDELSGDEVANEGILDPHALEHNARQVDVNVNSDVVMEVLPQSLYSNAPFVVEEELILSRESGEEEVVEIDEEVDEEARIVIEAKVESVSEPVAPSARAPHSVPPPPPRPPANILADETSMHNTRESETIATPERAIEDSIELEHIEASSDEESVGPIRTHQVSFDYIPPDEPSVASSDSKEMGDVGEEEIDEVKEVEDVEEIEEKVVRDLQADQSEQDSDSGSPSEPLIEAVAEASQSVESPPTTEVFFELNSVASVPSTIDFDVGAGSIDDHQTDEHSVHLEVSSDEEFVEPVRTHRVSFDYVPEDAQPVSPAPVELPIDSDAMLAADMPQYDVDEEGEGEVESIEPPAQADLSSDEESVEPVRTHRVSFSCTRAPIPAPTPESDMDEEEDPPSDVEEEDFSYDLYGSSGADKTSATGAETEDFSYDLYGSDEPEVVAEKPAAPVPSREHREGRYAQLAHAAHPTRVEDDVTKHSTDSEETHDVSIRPVPPAAAVPPPPPPPPPTLPAGANVAGIVSETESVAQLTQNQAQRSEGQMDIIDQKYEPDVVNLPDEEEVHPIHRRSVSFSSTDQLHILHAATSDAEEPVAENVAKTTQHHNVYESDSDTEIPHEDSSEDEYCAEPNTPDTPQKAEEIEPKPAHREVFEPALHPVSLYQEGRYAQLAHSAHPHRADPDHEEHVNAQSHDNDSETTPGASIEHKPVTKAVAPSPPPPPPPPPAASQSPPATETVRGSISSTHPRVFLSTSGSSSDTDEDSPLPAASAHDTSPHADPVDSSDEEESRMPIMAASEEQSDKLSQELDQLDIGAEESDTEDELPPAPVPVPSAGKRVSYAEPEHPHPHPHPTKPQHEGMYTQLAHATQPSRLDRQQTFSAHDLERREELFSPSLESSAENSPSHSPGPPFEARKAPFPLDRNSSVASVGGDLEPVPDRYSLAEGFDMRISEVVRPPHVGMYAQMAQAISPMRPKSVPNPSYSPDEEEEENSPAADRKKKTKSSRWSWLRGKHK